MKILIIGFGSIGQRHYRNLQALGYKHISIFDVDKKLLNHLNTKTLNHLNTKTLNNFQAVFICSPNNLHIKHATIAAQASCHLFIEKPLSHNLIGIDKLYKICIQNRLINMVACNMRFQPCLSFIKNYLAKKKLGQLYSISHEFGYYLPSWRPRADYTKNYAVKRSTGGGIILDDIHEFDLLFWLNNFSPVKDHKLIFAKSSNLKIQTEDNCLASFKFANKVLGLVKCDYLQQAYSRNCQIVGEYGKLEWDWHENIVWLKTEDQSKKLFQIKNWDVNQMYMEEIKYFLNCVKNREKTFNDINSAKRVLSYCIRK